MSDAPPGPHGNAGHVPDVRHGPGPGRRHAALPPRPAGQPRDGQGRAHADPLPGLLHARPDPLRPRLGNPQGQALHRGLAPGDPDGHRGPRPPITQDPAFRKTRAKVGANASILLYANYPKIVRQVYNWGLLGWTVGASVLPHETGIKARPDWLPSLSKLEKYLWPQIGAVTADAKGITFEGYGSLPAPDMLLSPLPAALSSIAIPTVFVAKRRAVEVSEMHKVKMIHVAAIMYSHDHAGKLPESLMEEKLAAYIGGYNNPLWREIKSGKYTYLGAGKAIGDVANSSKMVLIYINAAGEGDTMIVCFLDGSVRRMPRLQFRQVLAESQQGGK